MNLHPILRWVLWPFSLLYGAAVLLRAWLYRSGRVPQQRLFNSTVISVGNLTAGGTGKTPMVVHIAQDLMQRGERVGILTRGYRGERATANFAGTDAAVQRILSDEAQLLAHNLGARARLGVGANRYFHGLALEREGIQWLILDDGFQHITLARDADILLIDARDPFGSGHLLPAGRLREPKSAMRRADLIVITRSEHAPALESVIRRYTPAPIFYATTELKEVYLEGRGTGDLRTADWLGKRMFVFCGIGNPAAFVENVAHWGMDVAGHVAFRDHHRYSISELDAIERRATAAGAEALICTEKDSYNLGLARPSALPLYVCRIATHLTDSAQFWSTLYEIIERKRM
jgi:tetraacyldisaccharide 4'-kinase